jgi:hypothetical protein
MCWRLLPFGIIGVLVWSFAQEPLQRGEAYLLRLVNGDLIEGEFLGETVLGDTLPAWRFRTLVGTATIARREIAEILPYKDVYRHQHRIFIQPTAEPIGNHAFIGLAGLFALYAGIGFQDWLSLVGAHTLLPTIPMSQQLWAFNTKFTLLSSPNFLMPGRVSLAIGAQVSSLSREQQLLHLYGAASFVGERSQVSALLFAKVAGEDLLTVRAGSWGSVTFGYPTGAVGIGVGLDVRLPARHDVHLLAELWNSDIRSPSRTGILVGVRLANSAVALDFGLFWFGYPYAVPAANAVWTPL